MNKQHRSLKSLAQLVGVLFAVYWSADIGALGALAYPPQTVSLVGVKKVRVIGPQGRLKMTANSKRRNLLLKVHRSTTKPDWHLAVERRGETLFLEIFNVASRSDWMQTVRSGSWPTYDLQIEAPALPLEVSWHRGQVDVHGWAASVDLLLLDGAVNIDGGRGRLNLQTQNANVRVEKQRGEMRITGQEGDCRVASSGPNLDLKWPNGKIEIEAAFGVATVDAAAATVTVVAGQGDVTLRSDSGHAKVENFSGRLRGRSQKGSWAVFAARPLSLDIQSESGAVDVRWRAGVAKVFLNSLSGMLTEIKKTKGWPAFVIDSQRRVVKSSGLAKTPGGEVFVRTVSGDIRWR